MGHVDVQGAIASLPPIYWFIFFAVLLALVILMAFTSGAARLQGGVKRVENGPLGNARFATKKELNREYATVEYRYQDWCKIGREREEKIREFDIKQLGLLAKELGKDNQLSKEITPVLSKYEKDNKKLVELQSAIKKKKDRSKEAEEALKNARDIVQEDLESIENLAVRVSGLKSTNENEQRLYKTYADRRHKRYEELSRGLPSEPGLLLGDWHVKGKVQNPVGMKNAKSKNDSRDDYPNYPWYIEMYSTTGRDPVTGKKIKQFHSKNIAKNPDAWKGGRVMTRLCRDDVHATLVASSGAGKSAFFLYPQAIYAMTTGQSFVITDTKGDNAAKLSKIAKECFGYKTLSLDLRNPMRSCKFNIMHMVNKYTDLYEACEDKNSEEAISYAAKRESYAMNVATTIVKGSQADYGQNSFFYDSAVGLVQACVLLVSKYADKDERHIVSVYNLIQSVSGTEKDGDSEKTGISVMLDLLPEGDNTRWFAGPSAQNSGNSQASVVSTAMSKLLQFLDSEMLQILCGDSDIDAESFSENKTILFITMPEEKQSRYFMVSLVVQELYNELLTISSQPENHNKVPRPEGFLGQTPRITFFLDEFGTLPKIDGFEMMMSAARSRSIFFIPILQGTSQLERNYGKESAKIILDNCKYTFFTGISNTSEDAEIFSKKLGNFTVITNSVSNGARMGGSGGTHTRSQNMQARALMTADEIRNLPKGDFIIMRTADAGNTGHPIQCHFDIFMDWGITLANSEPEKTRDAIHPRFATKEEIMDHIRESNVKEPIPGVIEGKTMQEADEYVEKEMKAEAEYNATHVLPRETENPASPSNKPSIVFTNEEDDDNDGFGDDNVL